MFKKLWKIFLVLFIVVLVLLPYLAPSMATWLLGAGFPTLAGAVTALGTLPFWASAALGIGLAYLVDSETTTEILNDAATAVGVVGAAVGSAVGSAATGLFSGIWPIVLGAGALWFVLSRRNKDKEEEDGDATPRGDETANPSQPEPAQRYSPVENRTLQ